MGPSYIPYLELGIHTEVWSGRLFLPSVPANSSQDLPPTCIRHSTNPASYERGARPRASFRHRRI
jgi:hypothetical protein